MRTVSSQKSLSVLSTMMLLLSFAVAPASHAASVIADTPCDSVYYESLSARAWLEAQREITQNQNIILKPDSVFEYTCFDLMVEELAAHGTNMLSETNKYSQPLSSTGLDSALNAVVGDSLRSYISSNFSGYNLLGGHPAGAGLDHAPDSSINGSPAYTCDIMNRVWHAAKCINFASAPSMDGFFTLAEYATSPDKRYLPDTCLPITANWSGNLLTALTSAPWTNDPVQTYFEETEPQTCASTNCECDGDPIPTGLQVKRNETGVNTYQEHVCLQPGCRYHPGGDLVSGVSATAGCYGR